MTQTTHTLELVKGTGSTGWHKGTEIELPRYDVVLDGEKVGTVRKAMITHERRTKGNRYVNARWTSPGWRYARTGQHGLECQSRTDGIERILEQYAGLHYTESRELAASVRGVR